METTLPPPSTLPSSTQPVAETGAVVGLKQKPLDSKPLEPQPTFQSLVCEHFHCAPAAYERKVLQRCLYWRGRLLAPFILRLNPKFFAEDFKFIQLVGQVTSLQEVSAEAWRWRGGRQVSAHFLRRRGHIRVSGRKVVGLARELFQRQASREPHFRGPAKPSGFGQQVGAESPS